MSALTLATRGRLDLGCLGGATLGYVIRKRNKVQNNTVLPPTISVISHITPSVGPGRVPTPKETHDLWRDFKPVNRG
jgi:hypothetical protein